MKKLKILLLLTGILLSGLSQAQHYQFGQKNPDNYKKILERKLSYLKENLNLSKKESEQFEKQFREYFNKKRELNRAFHTEIINPIQQNFKELNQKEKQKIIQKKLEIDRKRYENNRDFILKINGFLPPDKVIKYFKFERQFNREMFKKIQKGPKNKHRNF